MSVKVYGQELASRMLLGTGLYPSLEVMSRSIADANAAAVTASVRRESVGKPTTSSRFWAARAARHGLSVESGSRAAADHGPAMNRLPNETRFSW